MLHTALMTLAVVSAGLMAVSQASAADKFLADRHVAKGVSCEMCHGKGNPAELDPPDINTCTKCHPTQALVNKTKNVKPHNPHTSPHYQDKLECTNCHLGHEKSENFCAQCHDFKFNVP